MGALPGALLWAALAVPALLGGACLLLPRTRGVEHAPAAAASALLAAGLVLLAVLHGAGGPVTAAGGVLRVDALSAYLLTVVGAVAVVATHGARTPRPNGRFASLMCFFLAAMTLAVLADNLGLLWVAVESTTIATAFLVAYGGGRHALEAAWKYVVLGSVGVAIAFLGLVLVHAAGPGGNASLSWTQLMTATDLAPDTARVGLALTVLGLATKAGLAPMHSWLPDAHSQAPAQVSALMSGVLLSVAFYAILRVKAVSDHLLGPGLMRTLLLAAGLLSLLVAGLLMLTQRSYKRLLAYSSIEHMGVLALGAAIGGPLATGAVLAHILGHGLVKAALFVTAGRTLAVTGTPQIREVHSLLETRPALGRAWLAGGAALLGFPPFILFFTEAAILVAGFQRGLGWAAGAALALLLLVFVGLSRHVFSMTLHGHRADGAPDGPAALTGPPDTLAAAAGPQDSATTTASASARTPGSPAGTLAADPATRGQRLVVGAALAVAAALVLLAWPLRDVLAAAVAALGGAA